MTDGESLMDSYDKQDAVEEGVKATVLTIVGGFPGFSTLVDGVDRARQIVAQQRFDTYFLRVVEIVQVLAQRLGIPVDEVAGDGLFYNAMVATGMEYQRSGDKRKLDALMATLSHTGSWAPDSNVVQRTVLGLVARLEPEHVIALKLLMDPEEAARDLDVHIDEESAVGDLLLSVVEVGEDVAEAIVARILHELYDFGVMDSGFAYGFRPIGDQRLHPRLTPLGVKVLEYLTPLSKG